jgi:hypothetical protein
MTDLRQLHGSLVLLKSRHDRHTPPTGMRGTIEVSESPGTEPQVTLVIDFPQMFTTQAHRRTLALNQAQIRELIRSETNGTFEFTIDDDLE